MLGLDLPIAPMACVLSERLQADALASLVKRVGMLNGPRDGTAVCDVGDLGAVELLAA